jgi:hypothetical protein
LNFLPRGGASVGTPGTSRAVARCVAMADTYEARPARVLTPEQRLARNAERRAEAEKAMREHEAAQKAFHDNRKRLREERLARERREAGDHSS